MSTVGLSFASQSLLMLLCINYGIKWRIPWRNSMPSLTKFISNRSAKLLIYHFENLRSCFVCEISTIEQPMYQAYWASMCTILTLCTDRSISRGLGGYFFLLQRKTVAKIQKKKKARHLLLLGRSISANEKSKESQEGVGRRLKTYRVKRVNRFYFRL